MTTTYVVTGVDGRAQAAATLGLQFDLPSAVVVHHRLDIPANRLHRTVADITGVLEEEVVDIEHACATCALREDILPTLQRLAEIGRWEAIIARLPVSASADQLCKVLHGSPEAAPDVRIGGVVCAVDGLTLVDDLTGSATLEDEGRAAHPGDDRGVGETLAGLVEYADVITAHTPDVGRTRGRGLDLVRALARPDAIVTSGWPGLGAEALLQGLRDHDRAEAWVAEVRRGVLPARTPEGTWRLELSSDRPLHPDRLSEHVEVLGAHRYRARGCFWLATRPGELCVWDGAGGHLSIGAVGPWHPGRPAITRIVVTGLDAAGSDGDADGGADDIGADDLRAAFEACLLTDAEMAERGPYWEVAHDGLEPWLGAIRRVA